ncbi:hypothetical protein LDENG_00272150, partial [Lucifuga dentata]
MPGEISFLNSCWFLGKIICNLYYLLTFVLTSASVGVMVLISVDRHVAICDPLRYSSIVTPNRAKICVCLCWSCSIIYNTAILKDHFSQADLFHNNECVVVINYISGAVDLIFTFIGPAIVMVVLYMRVFVVAVSQARIMRSQIAA